MKSEHQSQGEEQSSDVTSEGARYLVISSDCHGGLPNEQYREWLDPEYREAFVISRVREDPALRDRLYDRLRRDG